MEIDTANKKFYDNARTEEVQDIIERMPTKFGTRVATIVFFIFSSLLIFGWVIRYPDIVTGQLTINANISPIKLIVNSSGVLRLKNVKSQDSVHEGQIVAFIQNATSFDTLELIKNILKDYNPANGNSASILYKLPPKVALGELTSKYYTLLGNLQLLENFNRDMLYDKQIHGLQMVLSKEAKEIVNSDEKIKTSKSHLDYTHKLYRRDSILFMDKVTAEAELDQVQLNYLNSRSSYQNTYSSQIDAQKQFEQTQEQISEAHIQKAEKEKEIKLSVISSFNDLMDNMVLWEQKYVFKAPFNGHLQFLKFWTDGQFAQAGEAAFTVVPNGGTPYGQVSLPATGAGKVRIGQEVIIKLDNYPYAEYGSIKGTVKAISFTTNTEKTQQGNIEVYLLTVEFDKGLVTNYGKNLTFNQEARGSAEIITQDRKLIERFFDNLKYVGKK